MEKQLYIEQLDVGMVLSRPVRCQRHLIYSTDTCVSPRHIYRLRRLNVKEVFVKVGTEAA